MLRWISEHSDALVLVEFDVENAADPFDPAWFRSCLRGVERGVREYGADRELVGLGFVLPVVLGFFDVDARRTNWEQPIDAWVDDLRAAGFPHVTARHLHDFWWRPAHVVRTHH